MIMNPGQVKLTISGTMTRSTQRGADFVAIQIVVREGQITGLVELPASKVGNVYLYYIYIFYDMSYIYVYISILYEL